MDDQSLHFVVAHKFWFVECECPSHFGGLTGQPTAWRMPAENLLNHLGTMRYKSTLQAHLNPPPWFPAYQTLITKTKRTCSKDNSFWSILPLIRQDKQGHVHHSNNQNACHSKPPLCRDAQIKWSPRTTEQGKTYRTLLWSSHYM